MDCSDILRFGIFDTSTTSKEEDLSSSVLSWLTSREFKTESEARDAAASLGVSLPLDIPVGVNADGSYGSSHLSSWSAAAAQYLSTSAITKTHFVQSFSTANPDIINAWRDCVTKAQNAKGLRCWAEQTHNEREVLLNIEVVPLSFPFAGLTITRITHSENVVEVHPVANRSLGATVNPILFKRIGQDWRNGVTFAVETNDANYRNDCEVIGLIEPSTIIVSQLDGRISGYVAPDPAFGNLIAHDAANPVGVPENAGFSFQCPAAGKYTLFVEYAAAISRRADILVNFYGQDFKPLFQYPAWLSDPAAPRIPNRLQEVTGGWTAQFAKSFPEAVVDLRKGLNTINLRALATNEGGSGELPHIKGLTLVRLLDAVAE